VGEGETERRPLPVTIDLTAIKRVRRVSSSQGGV
jgi:hypothetical protein